ncbi:MAG: winged helix-turn-helix domain-containing protein [Alphaproteobacteria bacterium]|nr:winged helix-turn-helix domain-containing protein [Alphaproteobacteria bacterium]
MIDGPDISIAAAMMGDPARANMLLALMSGMALTAAELAREAGVTPSTASGHLAKLEVAGLVTGARQGRYRYFRIADPDVAHAVEALVTVAARAGHLRTRPGPKDEAMRRARSCYDHLAGRLAVGLFEHWVAERILERNGETARLTAKGRAFLAVRGIDVAVLEKRRRPLCRTCIDWSERRNHLGGSVGAAILDHAMQQGWAARDGRSRVVQFSAKGERRFVAWYTGGEQG